MIGIRWMVSALNFCVDFFLLMGTNQITGRESGWENSILGAFVGALYSWGCLVPELSFLRMLHWRIVSLILISAFSFGWEKENWKRGVLFSVMTLALNGAATTSGRDGFLPLMLTAGLIWLMSCITLPFDKTVSVEISGNNGVVCLTALRDTGNTLRDPVSGEHVLVVGSDTALALTGMTPRQLKNPIITMSEKNIPGLRLIPYNAVGQEHGLLLAKRFPKVKIGSRIGSQIIAFAPHKIGGESFQALTGGIA